MGASLIFVALTAISYYLMIKYENLRIPVPCLACESSKNTIWRCMRGTGYGSNSCNKKKKYDKYISDGLEINKDVNRFLYLVYSILLKEIPAVVYKNVKLIVDKIEILRNQILSVFLGLYDLLID